VLDKNTDHFTPHLEQFGIKVLWGRKIRVLLQHKDVTHY